MKEIIEELVYQDVEEALYRTEILNESLERGKYLGIVLAYEYTIYLNSNFVIVEYIIYTS